MRKICILLSAIALQMLGFLFASVPDEVKISSTSKFFFAYNQDGKVLWKIPLSRDFRLYSYAWNNSFAVANSKHEIRLFEITSGKLLWRKPFDVEVQSVGVTGDSVLLFAAHRVFFLAAKDGSIFAIRRIKRANEIPVPLTWSSSFYGAMQVTICHTSKFFMAYDTEAMLLWRQAIEGYRFLGTTADLFFLASNDSVKVYTKNEGNLIWKRGFVPAIKHVVIGGRTQVFLTNGKVFDFKSTTGELLKKE